MSATNTTTNYNLPIFIETDKPAWLVDFNGAMRSIDTQMKNNADAIATKSPILSFTDSQDIDFTVSGNVITAELDDGVAGNIARAFTRPVSAPASPQIPSVDTTNSQQLLYVGSGLKIDSGTLKAIDLDLTEIITKTDSDWSSYTPNNVTCDGTLMFAFNSDRSIGKIYGTANCRTVGYTGDVEFYTGVTIPNPSNTAYWIYPSGLSLTSGNTVDFGGNTILVEADGKIRVKFKKYVSNQTQYAYFFPCVYFFRNFGDIPTP